MDSSLSLYLKLHFRVAA